MRLIQEAKCAKPKSKTEPCAKGLQTCKNSENSQQSWNMNELYLYPELTMNPFQPYSLPSSTDQVNNAVQSGLNMSSETGGITPIQYEWATAVCSTVCAKDESLSVCSFIDGNKTRCFTVCPLTQHRGITFGCLAFCFIWVWVVSFHSPPLSGFCL